LPLLIGQLEKSARPVSEEQTRSREHSPDFEQLNSQIEEVRSDKSKKKCGKH
jgi:hypothetical protein